MHDTVMAFISKPVGVLPFALTTKTSYFGPDVFMGLIHQVQLQASGAQISLAAPLSFNTTLPAGTAITGQFFNLYRYENSLYTINLTGAEVDAVLEFSAAQWFNQMASANDHLLNLTTLPDGKVSLANRYYNFESAAGIDYIVDVSKPAGNKVHILGFSNGGPFSENETYTVALNSYRANGGGGHLTAGAGIRKTDLQGRVVAVSDTDIRQLLINYIGNPKTDKAGFRPNWRIIPENYYEAGKVHDAKLLFSNNME